MYDSVFVLSSGRITSIGPQGEFNWQVREVGGVRGAGRERGREGERERGREGERERGRGKMVGRRQKVGSKGEGKEKGNNVYLLQVDTAADWDTASEVIYNPEHPSWKQQPEHIMFVHGGFTPSAVAYSIQAYGKKVTM